MNVRTYYVVEMGAASYPAGDLRVYTRRPSDPDTARHAIRVRAISAAEAEQSARFHLNLARFDAMLEARP